MTWPDETCSLGLDPSQLPGTHYTDMLRTCGGVRPDLY